MIERSDLVGDPYADHKSPWSGRGSTGIRPSVRSDATSAAERHRVLAALGSVVYAVRVDDLVKIGFTTNYARRRYALGVEYDDLLAIVPATQDDETEIHRRLVDHRHHGREYYFPTPAVLREVDRLRALIGLDSVSE